MNQSQTQNPTGGAFPSLRDIRTFAYPVTFYAKQKGGKRYEKKDIESQINVGICTAIHLTQNARKAIGIKYCADFQYLLQKKYYDKNWSEGSSIFHALKVAKNFGLLPESEWTHTTHADRNLPYHKYIKKLQAISDTEIKRLILIANKNKIKAYASVDVTRSAMTQAIDNSKAGILARFVIGKEWWEKPIEPLMRSRHPISGHAVTESNYDGGSFRIANTWGSGWADGGTAYHILNHCKPTECWAVWYQDEVIPDEIEEELARRKRLVGKILNLIQQIIRLVIKLT